MSKKKDRGARDSITLCNAERKKSNYYNSAHTYIWVMSISFSTANPCASLVMLQF
jgi:hypothetical protein